MLVSSRPPPTAVVPSSSMTMYDTNSDRSHQTATLSMIPSTSLPKYFNVPFAIQHGYFRCIRYLLQLRYDPNERDGQLRTPLILCAYVDNDRWSLSLAQNLLEKGAKVALDDHARRNAMHHACALQRSNLVQLYLSCLDFNIEAKDWEGNTCLHYAAITGNCEIAELLMRSAEKIGVRLDQFVNRADCSAAVLALKYGHIECANQITHRDCDEFFVIPRPLSIYETPPTTDDSQTITTTTTTTILKTKRKTTPHHSSSNKTSDLRPSTLSFGLLKIIFNDSDTGYSTRLAGLCNEDKQTRHRQRLKHKKQETPQTSTINKFDRTESTIINGTDYCSTEALVNEIQSPRTNKDREISFESSINLMNSDRTSPRIQLLMQQHLLNKSNSKENNNSSFIQKTTSKTHFSIDNINKTKSKPTIYHQTSNSTFNHSENNSSRMKTTLQRPTTAVSRNQTSINCPSRLSSAKTATNKKSLLYDRIESASQVAKQNQLTFASDSSTYSQTLYAGRPFSAAVQNNHRSVPRTNDSSCSIREAKGVTSRYNKPEELFGLRPEELFGAEEHQPKMFDQRSGTKTNENTRLKRNHLQKHIWQQDVDKIIELYNIHHSSNYRTPAVPPLSSTQTVVQTDTITDSVPGGRVRRMSITKNSPSILKSTANPKQSTFASFNIPRRNSISRPSIKLTNT